MSAATDDTFGLIAAAVDRVADAIGSPEDEATGLARFEETRLYVAALMLSRRYLPRGRPDEVHHALAAADLLLEEHRRTSKQAYEVMNHRLFRARALEEVEDD